MDYELPEEYRMLKETVRRFVDREIIPIERDAYVGHNLKPDVRAKLEEKAKEIGLWQFDVPEEYGGLGMGLLAKCVVWEEMGRTIAIPTRGGSVFGPAVSPILYFLNDAQKEKYLYPVLKGERWGCFAQTEPEAGGDPGGMRTTAVRDGDDYVINGYKRFITGADKADFAQVFAITDREKRQRGGISAFLVEMDAPGVKLVRPQETMMDDRPWEISFDDVRVPAANRIGEEGEGFKFGQNWITAGRMRHAARGLGVAERCMELSGSYATQRSTFGAKLSERQGVQFPLVDIWMETKSIRALLHVAAARADDGGDIRYDSYMCKTLGDELAFRASDCAMQIHGGIGLTTDLPIEKLWRDSRSMVITEGPPEILRMALARAFFREYGG
ncbi:MAG: acyl-CoA dehydrogenase [Rhodospirillaceae bacterium]